jgi:hypothetical protein
MSERRLLQGIVAVACLLPLLVGGSGIVHGPAAFGLHGDVPRDLDSHFRYISGIFFATGIGFASCIPHIEHEDGGQAELDRLGDGRDGGDRGHVARLWRSRCALDRASAWAGDGDGGRAVADAVAMAAGPRVDHRRLTRNRTGAAALSIDA